MKRFFCMLVISALIMGSTLVPLNGEEEVVVKRTKAEKEILEVLRKFQAGYDARDVSKLDEFVAELYDPEDCLVVGTGTYGPKTKEWSKNTDLIKKLIKFDWEHWDDLKMKVEEARIRVSGNVAWVAMWGTSEAIKDKKKEYDRMLGVFSRVIEQSKKVNTKEMSLAAMLYILKKSAKYLERYAPEGDEYIFPIRVTAVLKKKKGKWLFQLMNYAFPIKDIPNIRIYR